MDLDKVKAIEVWPPPKNITDIRAVTGPLADQRTRTGIQGTRGSTTLTTTGRTGGQGIRQDVRGYR